MKRIIIALTIACAMIAGSAMAQSAKFTAVYENEIDIDFVRSDANCDTETEACGFEELAGATDSASVLTGFATIRVPQSKELLVGLSAQVGLMTETMVKGKRGTYSRALASADGGVTLFACQKGEITEENTDTSVCKQGEPGFVTLASRDQELEAILAGVIESCEVTLVDETGGTDINGLNPGDDGYIDTPDGIPDFGEFALSDCVVLDEMIGLGITTLSAHHFNFVFPDLDQGDYEIIAKFETNAAAQAEAYCFYDSEDLGCTDDMGYAEATAWAYIGKWMMTVQTVRAVKDEDGRAGDPIVIE